jgi:hypothetical protein
LTVSGLILDNTLGDKPNANSGGLPAAHNSDGFDIASSDHVTLDNIHVYNQDDCVAVTSGTNIIVSNMYCSGGHGLSIGSVGGKSNNVVNGVQFLDSHVVNSQNGCRIKSNSGTTGTVSQHMAQYIFQQELTLNIRLTTSRSKTLLFPTLATTVLMSSRTISTAALRENPQTVSRSAASSSSRLLAQWLALLKTGIFFVVTVAALTLPSLETASLVVARLVAATILLPLALARARADLVINPCPPDSEPVEESPYCCRVKLLRHTVVSDIRAGFYRNDSLVVVRYISNIFHSSQQAKVAVTLTTVVNLRDSGILTYQYKSFLILLVAV